MLTRREALRTMAGAAACTAAPGRAATRSRKPTDKPNLLFIWTDEQRADTLQVNGNFRFHMPSLNRLASESIVFRNTYVTQPVCTPSRGSILSGLYPHQHQCLENNAILDRSIRLQPELLGDAAYRTGYMGKFHLGDEVFAQHGFEDWISTEDEYIHSYRPERDQSARCTYHAWLLEQGYKANDTKHDVFTRDFVSHLPVQHSKPAFQAQHASRFIMEHRSEPWLLHVSFLEPHMPFFGPYNDLLTEEEASIPANYPGDQIDHEPELYRRTRKKYLSKPFEGHDLNTREGWQRLNRNYAGLCAEADQAIGRILWTLEASGQMDNTIVVFTSDHGEMMGAHTLVGKSVFYEEALRVPLLIRAPALHRGQIVIDQPVSHVNLVPTLLELLGANLPAHLPGESLLSLVAGNQLREDHVFSEWYEEPKGPHGRCIISPAGEKLVLFAGDNNMFFDRRSDPLELNNLFYKGTHEARISDMRKRLLAWQVQQKDTLALHA